MSAIEVMGCGPIKGEIQVQGSKNAVLPMMAGSVLNPGVTVLDNVPRIQDVFCMVKILESLGCGCSFEGHKLTIDAGQITNSSIPREEMGRMRSSIMLLGALLGRTGEAHFCDPGGCRIGERPIDLHLSALRQMGAEFETAEDGCSVGKAGILHGASIYFPIPSVGATENAIFAAAAARGTTRLYGCAKEPEIEELCHFLNGMGASIRGVGTACLVIEGGLPLHNSRFMVGGDRIVAGTYLMAAAATGGELLLTGVKAAELQSATEVLGRAGANIYTEKELLYISSAGRLLPLHVVTGPYPGFPTDLQSALMSVLCLSRGESVIEERVFENRFGTAEELVKMGAQIRTEEKTAWLSGVLRLHGANVEAGDLRGGAALVIAGMAAEGVTRISNCEYIMRGYEDICQDLSSLGAKVRRFSH